MTAQEESNGTETLLNKTQEVIVKTSIFSKILTKKVITISTALVTIGTIVIMGVTVDNRYVKADSNTKNICSIKDTHKNDVVKLKEDIKKSGESHLKSMKAVQTALVKLNNRLERKIEEDEYNRIEERILTIEDRYKNKPMSDTVKEFMQELEEKRNMLGIRLGYKK